MNNNKLSLETLVFCIYKALEKKRGSGVVDISLTYPPKPDTLDSIFGQAYSKFIVVSQRILFEESLSGYITPLYLYYRNKSTKGLPEFSSCELMFFKGKQVYSIFKLHIDGMTPQEFIDAVAFAVESVCIRITEICAAVCATNTILSKLDLQNKVEAEIIALASASNGRLINEKL